MADDVKYLYVRATTPHQHRDGSVVIHFQIPVIRTTKNYFITPEVFSIGLHDHVASYRRKKLVRWSRFTRKCVSEFSYGVSFAIVQTLNAIRPGDVPVLGEVSL